VSPVRCLPPSNGLLLKRLVREKAMQHRVRSLQLCLGEAVAACFCAKGATSKSSVLRHTLPLGQEALSYSDLLAKGI